MPATNPNHDIRSRMAHWAVLAAGVLITASATRNTSAIRLLRRPTVYEGTVEGGVATVNVASWFPVDEAILSTEHGELYARVKDLPLAKKFTPIAGAAQIEFELRDIASRLRGRKFTLTYFPWFRFLAEPIGFDAVNSVDDYVAECIRFLAVREGLAATVEASHDSCLVVCGDGMTISVEGMESLERIVISHGDATSIFDLEGFMIQIDRRTFPEAFAMGHELLATGDRLANMEVEEAGDHLVLRTVAAEG